MYLSTNELTDDSVTPVLKIFDSMSKIVGQYKTLEVAVKYEKENTSVKIRGDKKVDAYFNE